MTTPRCILSIDQGTTGSTVLIVDVTTPQATAVIGRATVDFQQHYPRTGWVEHDLEEIWSSVQKAATRALEQAKAACPGFTPSAIAALGITNQRETLCIFERKTGKPLAKAMVWQDKRGTDICARLKREGLEPMFKERTGLVLDPYFSGSKITWLVENDAPLTAKVRKGEAVLGTIDTYLIARLTGGAAFVTEASNASRTLAFNIAKGAWDADLIEALRVPGKDALAEVKDSAGLFGKTKGAGFVPDGVPITGALGDQQAALAGQACFDVGEAKCTYGTGAFFLLNLGEQRLASQAGMLTTVAWRVNGKLTYAFEGAAFIAGAAVQFLRDQMQMIGAAADTYALASKAHAAPEVYFVPALAGLGAPYWDPKAQGAFLGLTRGTTKGQMVRAALEGIAFEVCDLIAAMRKDYAGPIKVLRVDGGAAANDLLMQAQADLAGIDVDRPANLETTAFGAATFAGLGVGIFKDLHELKAVRRTERVFEPARDATSRSNVTAQLEGWKRAVRAVQVFAGTV